MKKVVIIGGGPGGYVCAIKLAQLGASVTLIEKDALGGTCLNVGCIPTKVFVNTAELFDEMKHASTFGLNGEISLDWQALLNRKSTVVSRLTKGVEGLLSAKGVRVVNGEARFVSKNEVAVGDEKFTAEAFVIASGSDPFIPPIQGVNKIGNALLTSTEALSLDKLPASVVIIGGGVIGIEFADIFSAFGVNVTVIEMLPEILSPIDSEISAILKKKMERKGVKFHLSSKVTEIRENYEGAEVFIDTPSEKISVNAEKVLLSAGRKPKVPKGLDNAGISLEKGRIPADEFRQTCVPGIYAIGDCSSRIMLAHVASAEGETAAENIMHGNKKRMDYKTVPSCVYTLPEIAGVGLTEREAKEQGIDVKLGKFPLMANGKSLIMNSTEGMIKFVVDKKYDEILGVHIIGKHATDLIVEGALALRLEATVDEIVSTIHAHPTVGEALAEAALAVDGKAIHC